MNILLVEDEPLAARRLTALLREVAPDATVVGQTESVRETLRWLGENPPPDLLLLDIQLADGLSFELFQKTHVGTPVIFTTAYDEYALRAFKVNSVDYLLKPIEKDESPTRSINFAAPRARPPRRAWPSSWAKCSKPTA